jgi:hypothetical protein
MLLIFMRSICNFQSEIQAIPMTAIELMLFKQQECPILSNDTKFYTFLSQYKV